MISIHNWANMVNEWLMAVSNSTAVAKAIRHMPAEVDPELAKVVPDQ
jgi:hypothetical protein